MSAPPLPLRLALFGLVACLTGAGHSGTRAVILGAVIGVAGFILEKRLQTWFDREVAFLATLGLLVSAPVTGPGGGGDLGSTLAFGGACVLFFGLASGPSPGPMRLVLAAVLAIGPVGRDFVGASWWSFEGQNLMAALFGSTGLLYGAPLLWAGLLGLFRAHHSKAGLVRLSLSALIPGTLGLLLATDASAGQARPLAWLPFFLPGMAIALERLRWFAARRPGRVVAAMSALFVLWNILFMEQYRRRQLPSDDTVSFARVASHSAALLSASVGTPFAWPANWIFARRTGASPDRWDGVAGRRLFGPASASTTTIEFGDDPSPLATDSALLLDGFGMRRTCERGWCRELDGAARLLLPLDNVGRGEFLIRIRARGEGTLLATLDKGGASIADLTTALSDHTLRYSASRVRPGIRVLSLSVPGGGRVGIDRITLVRDLGRE